jgi:hypothetical protein
MTDTATKAPGRDRPMIVGLVAIGLVVVLAIVAVVAGGRTADLDPASPEGVVQRYAQALLDEDPDAALALLADQDCTFEEYFYYERDMRVTLGDVEITDNRARVEVTVSWPSGEPVLDPYGSSERNVFQLIATEGEWRIDRAPWPFWACIENERP